MTNWPAKTGERRVGVLFVRVPRVPFCIFCIGATALLAAVACGGRSSNGSTCGPGTTDESGVCVAVGADASADAMASEDATLGDAGVDEQASDSAQSGADAADESDPCPPPDAAVFAGDCTLQCSQRACYPIPRCNKQAYVSLVWADNLAGKVEAFRTPDRPGDASADCPPCAGGFVYVLRLDLTFVGGAATHYSLSIGAPWTIYGPYQGDAGDPGYCPSATGAGMSCLLDEAPVTTAVYLVATTDPNAPARNGYLQVSGKCGL